MGYDNFPDVSDFKIHFKTIKLVKIRDDTHSMQLIEHQFTAMGSPCRLTFYSESQTDANNIKRAAVEEMERLEAKFSRYRDTSLLTKINNAAGSDQRFELDNETWLLLQYATIAYKESDGLFDVTSGVLRKAWDFKHPKLPDATLLESLKAKIGFQNVPLSKDSFHLPVEGMQMDFGGIVKEYAADVLANFMAQVGVNHGMVDLAGDICAVGPHPDGKPWDIGISHPANPSQAIAYIPLHSGGLASSGDYARFFELDGKKYSHLLNPLTGWPIEGLAGVSVWAEQCIVAGTLATVTMLKGSEAGKEWIKSVGAPFVTVDQDFNVETIDENWAHIPAQTAVV